MIINSTQTKIIDAALLASSHYISDSIEAICNDDYLRESEEVLSQVNDALDLLRSLREDNATASSYHDEI